MNIEPVKLCPIENTKQSIIDSFMREIEWCNNILNTVNFRWDVYINGIQHTIISNDWDKRPGHEELSAIREKVKAVFSAMIS